MIDIDSLQLILLNIGFAVHHADWNYKNVKSPFARIYLVKEGSAKLHIPNGRVQELKPKFLYMVPPFTLHSYECDDYFALYYIHIYENEISGISVLEDLMYPVEISASEIDALLVERLFNINPDISLTHYDPLVYDDTQHLISSINYQSNKPIYALLETKGILYQLLTRFLVLSKNKYEIVDDRVLKEAKDNTVPLLERLNFISIFTSNLDEFYMVRCGSLFDLTLIDEDDWDNKTGWSPQEQLDAIFKATKPLYEERDLIFDEIAKDLRKYGIVKHNFNELNSKFRQYATQYFYENVAPLLSPQIIDSYHPFPHMANKKLYIYTLLYNR